MQTNSSPVIHHHISSPYLYVHNIRPKLANTQIVRYGFSVSVNNAIILATKIGYIASLIYQHRLHGMIARFESNKFQLNTLATGSPKDQIYRDQIVANQETTTITQRYQRYVIKNTK